MNPQLYVSARLILCALQVRALAEWLSINHEKISPALEAYLGAFYVEIARRVSITVKAVHQQQKTLDRIF